MTARIGLIAEDLSDIEVIKILGSRITGRKLSAHHFVGKGCGPIARKTPGWCNALHGKGCNKVLLVHDRDKCNPVELRSKLEKILLIALQHTKTVVIPVEELEAWLLSDVVAIRDALHIQGAMKEVAKPELVISPKEHIGKMVRAASKKKIQYVNTVHNYLIAKRMDIDKLDLKCPSFAAFRNLFS